MHRERGNKAEDATDAGTNFAAILATKSGHPSTLLDLFFSTKNSQNSIHKILDTFLEEAGINFLWKQILSLDFPHTDM